MISLWDGKSVDQFPIPVQFGSTSPPNVRRFAESNICMVDCAMSPHQVCSTQCGNNHSLLCTAFGPTAFYFDQFMNFCGESFRKWNNRIFFSSFLHGPLMAAQNHKWKTIPKTLFHCIWSTCVIVRWTSSHTLCEPFSLENLFGKSENSFNSDSMVFGQILCGFSLKHFRPWFALAMAAFV